MALDVALNPAAPNTVPTYIADTRPSADAAALARDPRPHIPLPIPASTAQMAMVTAAKLGARPSDGKEVERVLKPYGVTILPYREHPSAKKPDARE